MKYIKDNILSSIELLTDIKTSVVIRNQNGEIKKKIGMSEFDSVPFLLSYPILQFDHYLRRKTSNDRL